MLTVQAARHHMQLFIYSSPDTLQLTWLQIPNDLRLLGDRLPQAEYETDDQDQPADVIPAVKPSRFAAGAAPSNPRRPTSDAPPTRSPGA